MILLQNPWMMNKSFKTEHEKLQKNSYIERYFSEGSLDWNLYKFNTKLLLTNKEYILNIYKLFLRSFKVNPLNKYKVVKYTRVYIIQPFGFLIFSTFSLLIFSMFWSLALLANRWYNHIHFHLIWKIIRFDDNDIIKYNFNYI